MFNVKVIEKDMTVEEKQQHLNNIARFISDIQSDVQGLDYEQFSKEEQVKESVFASLQMLGQAAHELAISSEEHGDLNFDTDILAEFRNARYDLITEFNDRQVWSVINEDLEEFRIKAIEAAADLETDELGGDIGQDPKNKNS